VTQSPRPACPGVHELGYQPGRNLTILFRSPENGYDELRSWRPNWCSLTPEVLVILGHAASLVSRRPTRDPERHLLRREPDPPNGVTAVAFKPCFAGQLLTFRRGRTCLSRPRRRRPTRGAPIPASPLRTWRGARRLLAPQLTETATPLSTIRAVGDDERGSRGPPTRALQDGNVSDRGSLSKMTMSASLRGQSSPTSPARWNHRGIAAGCWRTIRLASDVMPTCLTNSSAPCHAFRGEGRRIAGIACAQDRNAAVARIAESSERGVELRPQSIAHWSPKPRPAAPLPPDPGRSQDRRIGPIPALATMSKSASVAPVAWRSDRRRPWLAGAGA